MSASIEIRAAGNSHPRFFSIEAARAKDERAIATRLRGAGLPHEDVARHVASLMVARRGKLVGAIDAEVYGDEALLGALVVREDGRSAGLGDRLVRELEQARRWGVRRITTRADAPAAIAATEEFRGLCPSDAACLSRERRVE